MDSDPIKDNKIFELTDILEETSGRNNQEVIVVDGRGYEKNNKPKDLQEVINETKETRLEEEIIKHAAEIAEKTALDLVPEIAEKIARELVPQIAEKIIREEIEKLKKISGS